MHECDRVYRDKLVEEKDMENYDRIQQDITKKIFEVCIFSCGETLILLVSIFHIFCKPLRYFNKLCVWFFFLPRVRPRELDTDQVIFLHIY